MSKEYLPRSASNKYYLRIAVSQGGSAPALVVQGNLLRTIFTEHCCYNLVPLAAEKVRGVEREGTRMLWWFSPSGCTHGLLNTAESFVDYPYCAGGKGVCEGGNAPALVVQGDEVGQV